MGQVLRGRPQKIDGFEESELIKTVNKILTSPNKNHPTMVKDSRSAAIYALQTHAILKILRSQPSRGEKGYDTYRAVMRKYGNDRDDAILSLSEAHIKMINNISPLPTGAAKPKKRRDVLGLSDNIKKRLVAMFNNIEKNKYKEGYEAYPPHSASFVYSRNYLLLGDIAVSEEVAAIPKEVTPVEAVKLPPIMRRLREHGMVRPVSARKGMSVGTYATKLTRFIESMYGCTAGSACPGGADFINKLGEAWNFRGQKGDMGSQTARDIAHELHAIMSKITQGHAIREDAQFNTAMQALQNGDLSTGLTAISNMTAFNGSILPGLGGLHVITVDQEAIVVLHAGAFVKFILGKEQMKKLKEALHEEVGDEGFFWLGLGLYYQLLHVTGSYVKPGSAEKIETKGHVPGFNVALGWEGIVNDTPLEIIGEVSIDFPFWDLEKDVPKAGGTTEKLSITSYPFNVSFLGVTINFPTPEEERKNAPSIKLLPKITAGGAIYPSEEGVTGAFLGNVEFAGRWWEGDVSSCHFTVGVPLQYVLGQLRWGLHLEPIEYLRRFQWGVIGASLGATGMLAYRPETETYTEEFGERVEPYVRLTVGSPDLFGSVVVGVPIDLFGPEMTRAPVLPSVQATLTLSSALWQKGEAEERPAVAKIKPRTMPDAASKEYKSATEYLRTKFMYIDGPGGKAKAEELAGILEGQRLMNPNLAIWKVKVKDSATGEEYSPYDTAIELLQAGKLREGIKELRKIAAFKNLERAT